MIKSKSTAIASMVFALFSGAGLAQEAALPNPDEATSVTCQQAAEIAALYRQMDRTDGNVFNNDPLPTCEEGK